MSNTTLRPRAARALAAAVLTERCRRAWICGDTYLAQPMVTLFADERLRGLNVDRVHEAAADLVDAAILEWVDGRRCLRWSDAAGLHRESEHKAGAR